MRISRHTAMACAIVTANVTLSTASAAYAGSIGDCSGCVVGLYDDASRSSNRGTSAPGVVKNIYLGIDYAGGETGLSSIEFSVYGMRSGDGILITGVEWMVPPSVVLGSSVSAPADSSATSTGTGGYAAVWPACQNGNQTLARISFLFFSALQNKVFTVMHKFPPSDPLFGQHPVFERCDDPDYTPVRASGGCYVLNWNGDPSVPCAARSIAVEPRAWSSVKSLFR